jgi:hypothetical protein
MTPINRTPNIHLTHPTSDVNSKQPLSQDSTTGNLHGVPVSSSGDKKLTHDKVRGAGFIPLQKQPQVDPERGKNTLKPKALDPLIITRREPQKGPSIEPSAPPLDDPNGGLNFQKKYNFTEEKNKAGVFFTKVPVAIPGADPIASEEPEGIEATPLPISYFEEKSKEARNLATTYRLNDDQAKATIVDLKANFLDGQVRQEHLKQSFDFPMKYPNHGIETLRDGCSLSQEYKKGAEYCQSFLNDYKKDPSQKAAIMGYAKNLNDYCECLNKVSQELENRNFDFDTSANAKKLLAQSKQVDQDLWNFKNLPSCSIS